MYKANMDIRERAASAGIKFWEIAFRLNILDVALSKKLRFELPEAEKQRIFSIIEELKAQKEA